ncbi:4-alpha-glucanotransferase DPE2-like [Papaver somniferum]|uniref:4-alpha-glucanotransferase DPE2-like n=1 Tax=Papaver somniferum TaxID=3469 RepID=UPI000E70315E|nr:4-alpha-glucanotransferase DPE2-like [Papaver somniferum]
MVNLLGKETLKTVNLSFRIPYFTQWGQNLVISGSEPLLGSWNVKQGLLLIPSHQGDQLIWKGSIKVPSGFECEYSYYLVDDNRQVLRWEAGKKRKIFLPEGVQDGEIVELHDLWQSASETLFYRSAFKNVIFHKGWSLDLETPVGAFPTKHEQEDTVIVHFSVSCPRIEDNTSVYVTGSSAQLGQWNLQGGLKLSHAGFASWEANCVMRKSELPIKYKYCQHGKAGNISLEVGPQREIYVDSTSNDTPKYISLSDGIFRELPWRGAGVAIPMFSVRSEEDLGVGEFLDLKLLVDWAVDSGFHLVQLLPINDTSVNGMWWDSYPYSSLSVVALHPLYLRVQALSKDISKEIKQEIMDAKERLDGKAVDYEATLATKLSIAKKIFSVEKDSVLTSSAFKKFFSENEEWLKPYAAFCFLRDFFETSDHSQWGRFSQFSKEKLEKLVSKDTVHYGIICFHYYIQYHLYLQLSEASAYARKNRVILKGDLPIGVDRNSVDTWVNPNLFRMTTSTGAPPDYFDKNGQNWGFPTYNWEEMSKDNYAWWRARLTQMSKYFTAYRIDHILGFFRIWELPEHAVTGLVGKFRPSIPLSQEELEKEGIWDFDRLCRPYIRQEMLQEKFGDSWSVIASNFLNEYQKSCYEFKEDCNTEKKIVSKLKEGDGKSWLESEVNIRSELFDLIKNVVLIRDPEDARKFYPRFNLEDTSNFQALDDHSKNVLKRLYHDYYFQRQETLWSENAMKTLPALLNSSDMLACGEDLGLIPNCVHPVLQELGLLGLRIQRMPSESGVEFGIPSQYSHMTVCAPSCHDCSTMRAWWEEDEERRSRFYKTVVGSSEEPPSTCVPEVAHFILRQHAEAPSMWAIFPLQDLLALKEEYTKSRPAAEETINDPTNPKHYWRYRVHVSLETLMNDKEIKTKIRSIVQSSGRSLPSLEQADDTPIPVTLPDKQQLVNGQRKVTNGAAQK